MKYQIKTKGFFSIVPTSSSLAQWLVQFYNCLQVSKIFSHSERIKINNTLTALVHERGQAEGTHQF